MDDHSTTDTLPDEEVLLPYERRIMEGEWRQYLKASRQCWLAFINNFPELWRLFSELDRIFARELSDCEKQQHEEALIPIMLFVKAHKSIRVSIELAFSTHFTESFDAARAAVEAAAYAHKMNRDPSMAKVWLEKDEGEVEKNAFDSRFTYNKATNLFPSEYQFMPALHEAYSHFSEWGSHTTITSVGIHHGSASTQNSYTAFTKYAGADLQMGARIIFTLINAFCNIENALYDAFKTRLSLDTDLENDRTSLGAAKAQIAAALSRRFNLTGPLIAIPR